MGLLKKLLSGGGGTRSEALGGVQSTGIFQGGSKQHCETDLLKAHGAVKAAKWAKRLQKLGFLEDQGERRRNSLEGPKPGEEEVKKAGGVEHVVIQGVDGTKWGLHYPDLQSGRAYLPQVFDFRELQLATRGFNPRDLVGEGGFGKVFKAVLTDGRVVAVKQLDRGRSQGDKEFWVEVDMLTRLSSPYLLSLWGYCMDDNHRLLVYEYMRNGSLQDQLRRNGKGNGRPPLDWGARLQIALDVACGLEYLHEVAHPPVIHGDLKSSNVLLDFGFKAKVADLGLAKRASDTPDGRIYNAVLGTRGYCAPDYVLTGRMTTKSDVYSFGVVLLELITGRAPVELDKKKQEISLVSWALPLLSDPKGLAKIVDPRLEGRYNRKELRQVAAIAALCLQAKGDYRPLMGNVVTSLLPLVADRVDGNVSEVDELHPSKLVGKLPGASYCAKLAEGRTVVVRELPEAAAKLRQEDFEREAGVLCQVSSPHLLSPWGYCGMGGRRLLVYDPLPVGRLEEHLLSDGKPRSPRTLDWDTRLQIALDCARGLGALHAENLVHGKFEPSNVLLDRNRKAKASDFGMARLGISHRADDVGAPKGTFQSHVAPETASTGVLTARSDVYSYGVMLLELITGQLPGGAGADLLLCAMSLVHDQKLVAQVADPHLRGKFSFRDLSHVAAIAAMCLQPEPAHRPYITDVVTSLLSLAIKQKEETRAVGGGRRMLQLDRLSVADVAEEVPECCPENTEIAIFGERTPVELFEPSQFSSDELQVSLKNRESPGPRKKESPSEPEQKHNFVEDHGEPVTEPTRGRTAFLQDEDELLLDEEFPSDENFPSDEEDFFDEDDSSEQETAEVTVHDGWKSTPSGQVYVSRDYDTAELQESDHVGAEGIPEGGGWGSAFLRDKSRLGRGQVADRPMDMEQVLRKETKLWPEANDRWGKGARDRRPAFDGENMCQSL